MSKADEFRGMSPSELKEKLRELRAELSRERAIVAAGGTIENPMKIRNLRRTIARILTVIKEAEIKKRRTDA